MPAWFGVTTTRLGRELGLLLRIERDRRGLSQQTLAERAGLSQQLVSHLEKGVNGRGLSALERLLAVLELQVAPDVRPLGFELNEQISQIRLRIDEEQAFWRNNIGFVRRYAGDLAMVLDGPVAALLQGLPVPVARADLLVAEEDLDGLSEWIMRTPGLLRYRERFRDFEDWSIDPRIPGPLRWRGPMCELRVQLVAALPVALTLVTDDRQFVVRPLADLLQDWPEVARVAAAAT